ncbi:MAG: cob(I)yrinic acid a,c-diamide adenosyltransferase [Planctomycetota bacterium]|jgi:cob(I)alamin adenosyltransferase
MNNRMAAMTGEKGFILLNTGNGKGKTTAAVGAALRMLGHGGRVCVIQFLKSKSSGELKSLEKFGNQVEIHQTGKGFVGVSGKKPKREDVAAAKKALELARDKVNSGAFGLVILDEITYIINCNLAPVEDVCALLDARHDHVFIFLTGRDAHEELVKRATMVTEMNEVKHPYHSGIKARKGIEF